MRSWHSYPLKWRLLAIFLSFIAVAVIVVHTYLAGWLLDYVNNVLANIKGYPGSAQSISIDFYRGAYRIHKLVINKESGKIPTPFLSIEETDLSLQWSALFHGRIVSSVDLTNPVINFAVKESASQTGTEVDWNKPIRDLMPIDINYVSFKNGSITYQDFASTPRVNVYVHHMDGILRNLRNVEDPGHPLPSTVKVEGDSIGKGQLKIVGRMNILKPVPDMNLLLSLENVDLPALNDYGEAYASLDFKSGKFNLYSLLNVKDDQITGYVKPVVTNLSVDVLKNGNPLQIAWKSAMAAILQVFTNLPKDQFATRVDLQGRLENIDTNIWSALGGVIRNAFIQSMTKGFDETGNHGAKETPP